MSKKPSNLEREVDKVMTYNQFRKGWPYNFPAWYFSGLSSATERYREARINDGEFNPNEDELDRGAECLERLKREHPELVQEIRSTIDRYKHSVPDDEIYIRKLYEAYKLLRSYGASDKALSVQKKF
jgi:hypothetical protein